MSGHTHKDDDFSADDCCLHDLHPTHQHAPGRSCCHCGDVYLPHGDGPHGEHVPEDYKARAEKSEALNAQLVKALEGLLGAYCVRDLMLVERAHQRAEAALAAAKGVGT